MKAFKNRLEEMAEAPKLRQLLRNPNSHLD